MLGHGELEYISEPLPPPGAYRCTDFSILSYSPPVFNKGDARCSATNAEGVERLHFSLVIIPLTNVNVAGVSADGYILPSFGRVYKKYA